MKAIKKKHYIIPIIICVLALAGLVFFYLTGSLSKSDKCEYVYIDDNDNLDSIVHSSQTQADSQRAGTAQLQVAGETFRLQQEYPDRQICHRSGRRYLRRIAETEERSSDTSKADHSREQDYRQAGRCTLPEADDGQSDSLDTVQGLLLLCQDGL